MWNYLPVSSPEFRVVSEAGGCHPVEFETDSRVDDIQLERVTGEGRFGEVRARAWGTTHWGGARGGDRLTAAAVVLYLLRARLLS